LSEICGTDLHDFFGPLILEERPPGVGR
jgi:hypothetical protein